jgi:hypothetical protein
MSSATSIERAQAARIPVHPQPEGPPAASAAAKDDAGFRPWHFFVLVSLIAATATVILSRRSTPEHLILISITIGAVGLAAAAFYRTLLPLASPEAAVGAEPLSGRARSALEREKTLVLRSLKELEFDKAMGKLSERDFDEMAGRLRARAISLIKQLDDETSGYRAVIEKELASRMAAARAANVTRQPAPAAPAACVSCGTSNDPDAAFCKRCGHKL